MVPYCPRKVLQVPKVEMAMAIVHQTEYLCLQHRLEYTLLEFAFDLGSGELIPNMSLLHT